MTFELVSVTTGAVDVGGERCAGAAEAANKRYETTVETADIRIVLD